MNRARWAAAAWGSVVFAAVVLVAVVSLGVHLARGLTYETSLLALLPQDAQRPLVAQAVDQMAEAGSRQALLLVGDADPAKAARAADAAAQKLQGRDGIARVTAKLDGDVVGLARDFYLPYRYQLLTPAQRVRLTQDSDQALLSRALEALYSPVGAPRLVPLESDPLNLFTEALLDRAPQGTLHPEQGHLVIEDGATTWVAVLVELSHQGLSLGGQRALVGAFDAAEAAARASGAAQVVRAGFAFHSEAAARQAQREMSTIGLGSLLGVVLLMLLTFRAVKPLGLVLLPIAVGSVTALGLSQLCFARLHLLTFVFGTSVIGVAVDYGILFLCGRVNDGPWDPFRRRREILPSVATALGTSLLAYAALAAMPFPILRQMGVFTMIGLLSAWLTALLWLPPLSRALPDLSQGALPRLLLWLRRRWPRVGESRALTVLLAVFAVAAAIGIFRLRTNDDVHGLYASSPELLRQQATVERLMQLPAAGQFFLLTAPDPQTLLQQDEALSADLEALHADGTLGGFQSVSRFVPSQKTQREDRALEWRRLYGPQGIAQPLFEKLGSPQAAEVARAQAAKPQAPLTPQAWLASPLSLPFRPLWLGQTSSGFASLVTVSGVSTDAALSRLAEVASRHPGVQFVDHLRDISGLLGHFRVQISWLLAAGYAVVSLLLFLRYRKEAWRVLLPALLACVGTAGLLGWLRVDFNLFCVFGLLLSLDMGVDYGVYMQERGAGDFRVSVLSASLAAITTLLSFGLLALSHTPALRVFGLTVLFAIGGSWLLAPCFQKRVTHDEA